MEGKKGRWVRTSFFSLLFFLFLFGCRGDSKHVSHTLCRHFYAHKLPGGTTVGDLTSTVREE